MPAEGSVLVVKNLTTHFYLSKGVVRAVRGVSFAVGAGRTLGIVGESGCGKSVMTLSLLGLIAPPGRIVSGEVWLDGRDLLRLPEKHLRRVRGREIALVFQDAMASLNPVLTVGTQLTETILSHEGMPRAEAWQRAAGLLARVGLPDPEGLMRRYPFQLSGGMRQRVMIAMALSLHPKVLVADEPTTALDVTVQAQILTELRRLRGEFGAAVILVSHDLGVVAAMADEVAVMYAGSIVEHGPVAAIFARPAHPYTRALLAAVPVPDPARRDEYEVVVKGEPPDPARLPAGCCFHPRCPEAAAVCRRAEPVLKDIGSGHLAACYLSG
ncbi:MAG: ABC transporter ATP-binding protein [Bacillota bacterium]